MERTNFDLVLNNIHFCILFLFSFYSLFFFICFRYLLYIRSDSRFGDVLKLKVTLTTITTTTTTTTIPTSRERFNDYSYSNRYSSSPVIHVDVDYSISSKIISMIGEGYPSDHYYYVTDDDIANNYQENNSTAAEAETDLNANANTPIVSIERSTPCVPSYCTNRPEASKSLIQCLCYSTSNSSNSNTDTDDKNLFIDINNWIPLPPFV